MTKYHTQIQFLGQAGFLIHGKKTTILIDPYLSNYVVTGGFGSSEQFSRNFPPPILPENLPILTAVFITHDHADHCDLDTLKVIGVNYPYCKFIGPKPVRDKLKILGIMDDRLMTPCPENNVLEGNPEITFCSIPSAHYENKLDLLTGESEFIGYLIRVDDVILYHSGDTILYDGIVENVLKSKWDIDITCLPINGRDHRREQFGIVGNLNPYEAVNLAIAINAKVLIPMHNDLFTINQEDPEIVRAAFDQDNRLLIKEMSPGDRFLYKK